MNNKQKYIQKILRKYGILVNFTGEPKRRHLPSKVAGENLKQWASRVLGDEVSDIYVYIPTKPHGNTSVERFADATDMDFLKDILRRSLQMKEKERQDELAQAEQEFKERTNAQRARLAKQKEGDLKALRDSLQTIGIDTLEEILNEVDDLQPSVREFLTGFINSDEVSVDIRTLLTKLVVQHNEAAIAFRKLRNAQCEK